MAKKISYWERRKATEMYEYMEDAEAVADQIAKLYLKASRYISMQADDIFEKYVTKHKLTKDEALELINTLQDRTSLDELLEKLRNGTKDKNKEEILSELEAPAYRARLERLEQLQNQLDYVMKNIYQQEKTFTTSHYVDLANEAYYRGIFGVQQQVGAAFSFHVVDPQVIDQVIKSRWSGENYSKRIWKNTQALAQDLKEELLINLVTGRTNREAAEIIQSKFAAGASAARRLIRTESNYVATELNFKAYEECGIEKYRFCAVLDLRTSETCRKLDRKIFPVSERETGVNCPPMHPWCRSTHIGVITEELANSLTRKTRDPVTGEIMHIPASMTYQEWYDKYVKGNPEAELAEKQIKNRAADRKQHKKYREILGDEIPEELDEFQRMKYTEGEKWEQVKKKFSTYNEIDKKDWSTDFKEKTKQSYDRFREKGISLSTHALSRLPRLNKKGYVDISEDDLLKLLKGEPNYTEGANKEVYFSEQLHLAAIKNVETKDIVTLVRAKKPKGGWENA